MSEKFGSIVEGLGKVPDNAWAFSIIVIAGILAGIAHYHVDATLTHFAELISTTAGVLFRGGSKKAD